MTVKEKEKELLHMSDRDLVNRILAFPDRQYLNRDEDGKRRKYPSGEMAVHALRHMNDDPDWTLSDKQKWAIAHSFAEFSSNELKVAGIKFANADPILLQKSQISSEGTKTVYDMQFHLVPEPENKFDKNAVAVYVNNATDNNRTRIGYVPAAYVGTHPITDPMTVNGTLTDHSNGHFKTISYVMDMDTEAIHNAYAANNVSDRYTYRMPFILNGEAKEGAAEYLNTKYNETERLNKELEYWQINGQADNVYFEFPGNRAGHIVVETKEPLNEEAMRVCGSYFRYSLESHISSDLKRDGYVEVPLNQPAINTRDKTYFSLQSEPTVQAEPSEDVQTSSDTYTYRMPFTLNGAVKEGTADYLNTQFCPSYNIGFDNWEDWLNDNLEYRGAEGKAEKAFFEFLEEKVGNIVVETTEPLNADTVKKCSDFFYASLPHISIDLKDNEYVDVPLNVSAINTRYETFSLQTEPILPPQPETMDIQSGKTTLNVLSGTGVNADTLKFVVKQNNETLFDKTYYCGRDYSYDRKFATEKAPFKDDLIDQVKQEYKADEVVYGEGKRLTLTDDEFAQAVADIPTETNGKSL